MPTHEPREQFQLILQDAGDRNNVPVMPRLRRLLKSRLRGYGIRCVEIRGHSDSENKPERCLTNVTRRNETEPN